MSGIFDPYGSTGGGGGTAGFPTSYGDSFRASWEYASNVTSFLGLQEEMQKRWEDSIRKYNQRIGKDSGADTSVSGLSRVISLDNSDQTSWQEWFLGTNDPRNAEQQKRYEQTLAANEELKKLNDPSMPGLETIFEQARGDRQEIGQRLAQAEETGPLGGSIARFAGGVGGSLTLSDPFNLATLPFGGFGKTLAVRLGTEVAVNAGLAGITQDQFVNPQMAALGEEVQSPWEAAVYGGVGAGALHLGGVGLGRLTNAAINRAGFSGIEIGPLDFEDPQLRQMFERNPDSPTARAGLSALDDIEHFSSSNPYANTSTGLRRFEGEVTEIMAAMQGKTSTAIARVLPDIDTFTIENLDFHTQVVREQSPEIFDRLNAANDRVTALEDQIAQATGALDSVSVGDALGKIDETSGALVKSFEADLQNSLLTQSQRDAAAKIEQIKQSLLARQRGVTDKIKAAEDRLTGAQNKAEQLAAARDLDKLYKLTGEDVLEMARDSVTIPMANEIKGLNASRKAAKKEFRAARIAMDQAIERVKAVERVKELLKPAGIGDGLGNPLRYDVAEATAAIVDTASKNLPDSIEALVKIETVKNVDGVEVRIEPKGDIDLGNGVMIPREFKMSDPNNPGFEKTAGEIFDDLVEDEKLLDAMRTCAI